MRVSAAAATTVLAALTVVPAAGASTAAPPGWTRTDRVALVSVVSVQRGSLAGHPGNWHTLVASLNGADGITGTLTDWTCADGVVPDYENPGPEWACAQSGVVTLEDAVDENGSSLVTVSLNRPVRNLVVDGTVKATAADGTTSNARVHLVAHAFGDLTRTFVDSEDGTSRQVIEERSGVVARGWVAGVRVHRRGAENTASGLVAVTTWTQAGSLPSFG